jgi:hypothetical protein
MNVVAVVNNAIAPLKPALMMIALVLAVLAAWLTLLELLPVLGQIFRPRGSAQAYAITGACIAHIARG